MKVNINGKVIHYKKIGKGKETILFVHGWGGSKESLNGLASNLSDSYRCYLIDLPGHGRSSLPENNWGIEEYADTVKQFITKVIGGKTIYIGHSFGGALGVYMASHNDVISRLVLCAPSFKRATDVIEEKRVASYQDTLKRVYASLKRFLTPLRKLFYKVFYPNSDNFSLPLLESNFRKIISQDLTPSLDSITTKTLILWGADDIETPLNDAYILRDSVKTSVLVVKGSYGHELPVRYPELISSDIKLFLEDKTK